MSLQNKAFFRVKLGFLAKLKKKKNKCACAILFYKFPFQKINSHSWNLIIYYKNIKNRSSAEVQSKKMTMKFQNFEFCNFLFTSVES